MIYKVLKPTIYNIQMNTFDKICNEIKNLPRDKITSYILDFDYETNNKLLLCAQLHILFDNNKWTVLS